MKKSSAKIQEEPETYKTKDDISQGSRLQLIELMNQRLATAIDLLMQLKQAHWNALMKRMAWTMPTRRTCSRKYRGASINGSGSSKPTPRPRNRNRAFYGVTQPR